MSAAADALMGIFGFKRVEGEMSKTEVKTADLVGVALDWAVAWAEGDKVSAEDGYVVVAEFSEQHGDFFSVCYSPSTDWSQGGSLIERHEITIYPPRHLVMPADGWGAQFYIVNNPKVFRGSTPLIAAMRAIVAAKLGDVVSVPSELLK